MRSFQFEGMNLVCKLSMIGSVSPGIPGSRGKKAQNISREKFRIPGNPGKKFASKLSKNSQNQPFSTDLGHFFSNFFVDYYQSENVNKIK